MIRPRRTRDASTRYPSFAGRLGGDGAAPIIFLALLAVICIGGGASRGDALGQGFVRGAALLAIAGWLLTGARFELRAVRAPLIIVGAAMSLAALQLLPLPFGVWSALPGRDLLVEVTRATGSADAWRPLAIVPDGALNALLSLAVPLAVLFGMSTLSPPSIRRLVPALLAIVGLSMMVALFQLSTGSVNNPLINDALGQPSGLFANRNHQALLLSIGVLLAAGWGFDPSRRVDWRSWTGLGLIVIFCLLILATGSRAGLVTLTAALIVGMALARPRLRRLGERRPRWPTPVACVVVLAVAIGLVLLSMDRGRAVSIDRLFTVDPVTDMRVRAIPTLRSLVAQFFPWGSGLGSFDAMFRMAEPLDLLKPSYFNHAHDDFVELLLETGLPGLVLLFGALVWWARSSWTAWRNGPIGGPHGRIGSATILLVLIASVWDYPARTPIVMAVLAVAAGWLSIAGDRRPG